MKASWPAPQVESPDVHEERLRVEALGSYDGQAMVIRDLHKVYPGQVRGSSHAQLLLGMHYACSEHAALTQLLEQPWCCQRLPICTLFCCA
jgi:hypothetical protein